jgi:hypothetical protein
MLEVLQINIALWGMLACSTLEIASWVQAAF